MNLRRSFVIGSESDPSTKLPRIFIYIGRDMMIFCLVAEGRLLKDRPGNYLTTADTRVWYVYVFVPLYAMFNKVLSLLRVGYKIF